MFYLSKLAKLRVKLSTQSINRYALYVHDKKVIVMTNSHYLIEISTALLDIDVSENTNSDLFIPLDAFAELEKAAKKLKQLPTVIQIDGNFIKTVAGPLVQFECWKAERSAGGGAWWAEYESFPDYESVMPGRYEGAGGVNAIGMAPALLASVLDFFRDHGPVKLMFSKPNKVVKIIPDLTDYEGAILKCIVMPTMIGVDYCKDWE